MFLFPDIRAIDFHGNNTNAMKKYQQNSFCHVET